ncbi:hypothetical protein PT974_07138 [Cladobotryum mycophilum]|uniref:Uncharacterized protein n=1 Tax=Cladobotryum mycophilum TaxID=491253 RepID=A0ABR0SNK2_9HYPO
MANTAFHFYYAPTWDWPPEGPIKLGNVLASIQSPERPLCTAPLPNDHEVFSSEKKEVKYSKAQFSEGKFSILTTFLKILGLGVEAGADWKKSQQEEFTFERIVTNQFVPRDEYIQRCIEAPAVRRFLDKSRYRKPVYIITGIKVAYGAKAGSEQSVAHDGKLALSVDSAVLGGFTGNVSALAVEPQVEHKSVASGSTSWQGSSDFVFAYRVTRVRVAKKQRGHVIDHDDYTKGAMLGNEAEGPVEAVSEVFVLSHEEASPGDEGYSEVTVLEDGEAVSCAVPRAEAF